MAKQKAEKAEEVSGEPVEINKDEVQVLHLKCASCGKIYHKTTSQFTLRRRFNGAMFELGNAYGRQGANWSSFPADKSIVGDSLVCPGCEAPYRNIANNLFYDKAGKEKAEKRDIHRAEKMAEKKARKQAE